MSQTPADAWVNPLRDPQDRRLPRIAGPSALVIVCVSGDLSRKKLLPAMVWWPSGPPTEPINDPIGALCTRRITDATTSTDPVGGLQVRATHLNPGDTDLAWTRTSATQASYLIPNQPKQVVALPRGSTISLLSEELRRLDNDTIFTTAMATLLTLDAAQPERKPVTAP